MDTPTKESQTDNSEENAKSLNENLAGVEPTQKLSPKLFLTASTSPKVILPAPATTIISAVSAVASASSASFKDPKDSSSTNPPHPVPQKRRRVTRACDECRKKKVKCDGQQPCVHCTVYNYNCTYDQPSNRSKKNKLLHHSSFNNNISSSSNNNHNPYNPNSNNTSNTNNFNINVNLSNLNNHFNTNNNPHIQIDQQQKQIKIMLPPLETTLNYVNKACDSACLFKYYNRKNLLIIIQELYNENNNQLIKSTFSKISNSNPNNTDNKAKSNDKNDKNYYNYYNASYTLLRKSNIIETNDMTNLITLFTLVIFLQCTARLSTCYSYIGIVLRSALRIGLHRKIQYFSNPIEAENRKRLFWSIYKMDVYINTMLGLPSISNSDVDQDLPAELDDENITDTEYLLENQKDNLSLVGVSNHHTKLVIILNHVVKNLYPITTPSNHSTQPLNNIKVKKMEKEIQDWLDNLPIELNPYNVPIPQKYYRQNRLLYLSFLHIQIVLYRPFIHLISHKYLSNTNIDLKSVENAKNCIASAIKVVELAIEMFDHSLLNGAYWFSIYPIFYSVACLVYYIHENSNSVDPTTLQIRSYAEKGKNVLIKLRDNSVAASRTYHILNVMFDKLNKKT
ncbi:uncharacterized protein ASCRUDRAFT_62748, partial [Ascoidea rubescens DSM 1968]